jgi:hypothetical protein
VSDVTENTDGKPVADKAGTETPTDQQVTTPADDSGQQKGKDGRIDGLVAERERLKKQLESVQAEKTALEEKNKTEEQKRIDEAVDEKVAPHRAENKRLREFFFSELDRVNKTLPEEHQREINREASLDVLQEQFTSLQTLSSVLSSNQVRPRVDGSGNPAVITSGTPTVDDYNRVALLASSNKAEDIAAYDKEWPAIERAIRERRLVIKR